MRYDIQEIKSDIKELSDAFESESSYVLEIFFLLEKITNKLEELESKIKTKD